MYINSDWNEIEVFQRKLLRKKKNHVQLVYINDNGEGRRNFADGTESKINPQNDNDICLMILKQKIRLVQQRNVRYIC